ncbi:redox-active protein [Pseudoflavonifractor sp. AF19-9AC]|uniref:C-GCAxxG-C-C family (seleno)protein n=1 Tax=Pseudoflavonifractor sp. AF19-9AC TaxID=2292244 RepID=UPI000E50C95D|nr:C-GCAxxG-C-C family (seleno)protein [Pseudoflavonifractor sp. AF19-9AC]RHR04645.1 redox-active protein [Pseudoflavonifractor sp. AF19-9AC]
MLKELIESGFGDEENYNCAERIIYGANIAYGLGFDKKTLKLFAGMGGGMGVGEMCGAITSSVAIISHFFVKDHANEGNYEIKPLLIEFINRYVNYMNCYRCDCSRLKELYRNPVDKCSKVIAGAATVLDEFLLEKGADIPALRDKT